MKKIIVVILLLSLGVLPSVGQQWTGSADVNGQITRNGNISVNSLIFGKFGSSFIGNSDPFALYSVAGGTQDMVLFGNSENTLNLRLYDGSLKFGKNELPTAQILNDGSAFFSKVGIGTSNPQGYLQVNPSRPVIIKNNGGNGIYGSEIGFNAVLNTSVVPNQFKKLGGTGQQGAASMVVDYSGNIFFQMFNGSTENEVTIPYSPQITFSNTGSVGIGTTMPDAKLAVKGTVHAQEVKVDLNVPGPDYVFEENYNLPSLTEIENYIKQNKHLPEVPSAKQMEANGINLSEMNMLLLRKIEELTLHLIDQNKLIRTSHASADASAKKVEELTLHSISQSKKIDSQEEMIRRLVKEVEQLRIEIK